MLAGDAAAFTAEVNTMRLRPITYELLVLAHKAIMSVFNAKPEGLPGGRQPIPKALAWLVAVAVGAKLIAPLAAEKAGRRLLAQAENDAKNAGRLSSSHT